MEVLETFLNGIVEILATLAKFDITQVNENSMATLANFIAPFVKWVLTWLPGLLPKIAEILQ